MDSSRRLFLIPVFIITVFLADAEAQWTAVATNLIGTGPYRNSGAMTSAGGVAWAGLRSIYKSLDKGLTWQPVTRPFPSGSIIQCLSFYDSQTGIVCTDNGAFITHDQGATWKTLSTDVIYAAAFSGSANDFVFGDRTDGKVYFTRNGGATWAKTWLGTVPKDFYPIAPGYMMAYVENAAASFVSITDDYGATWKSQPGTMEPDAHTFGVMACNENVIFGVNEEGGNYSQDNRASELYLSTDRGASFKSILNYPLATLSGCMLITPGVIYVPAGSLGFLESIDTGKTWKQVSGPDVPIDSRDLISIDDTVILAADRAGTIWRKIESRAAATGPKGTLSVTPNALVFPDSVAPCAPSASATIKIDRGCGAPTVSNISLTGTGADPNYFTIVPHGFNDSTEIQFSPDTARKYSAEVLVTLSDGNVIAVPVEGYGKAPKPVTILTTIDLQTDTIGGTVYIPIVASPRIDWGNLDLSVHFDTSMLIYGGAFSVGKPTDQTIDRQPGYARLHFDEKDIQSVNDTIGFVRFDVFPTVDPCTTVLFDSIDVKNNVGVTCAMTQTMFSATICATIDCGTPILSNFVRYGRVAFVSIVPNPTSGVASLHTQVDLGDVAVTVSAVDGSEVLTTSGQLSPAHGLPLDLRALASGAYTIQVRSQGGYATSLHILVGQ